MEDIGKCCISQMEFDMRICRTGHAYHADKLTNRYYIYHVIGGALVGNVIVYWNFVLSICLFTKKSFTNVHP